MYDYVPSRKLDWHLYIEKENRTFPWINQYFIIDFAKWNKLSRKKAESPDFRSNENRLFTAVRTQQTCRSFYSSRLTRGRVEMEIVQLLIYLNKIYLFFFFYWTRTVRFASALTESCLSFTPNWNCNTLIAFILSFFFFKKKNLNCLWKLKQT